MIVVRHGRTAANREGLFRGLLDIPLDDVGLEQASRTASYLVDGLRLAAETTRAIYTSRLSRATATARPTAEKLGLPIVPHPGLLDVDVGRWQGRAVADVLENEGNLYGEWAADPAGFTYPGGESLRSAFDRASLLLDEIAGSRPGDYLLFTHRVPAKLLVAAALGLGPEAFWRIRIDNASVSRLEREGGGQGLVVTLLNCTEHLR